MHVKETYKKDQQFYIIHSATALEINSSTMWFSLKNNISPSKNNISLGTDIKLFSTST